MNFRPLVWLINTARNRLKASMIGRIFLQMRSPAPLTHLCVVSATRMDEKKFWTNSALGQSLSTWKADGRLSCRIAFNNKAGLPTVYNAKLREAGPNDAVLFVHDDIWLDDPKWIDKIFLALRRFDIVGVAGNTRRVKGQPAWLFSKMEGDQFLLDGPYLSGAVAHGKYRRGEVSAFGATPANCELLDGLFIAARNDVMSRWHVRFDERFDFHFYDLDFCRSARTAGLSMGTWPIEMTHQSPGAFNSPGWKDGLNRYMRKWRT